MIKTYSTDWIENRAAQLVATARASAFAKDIFADADHLREEYGYLPDVALGYACRYWLANPVTGEITLPQIG